MAAEHWITAKGRTQGDWLPYRWPDPLSDLLGPLWMLEHMGPERELLRLGLLVTDKHCNRLGTCHGGVLATLVDNGMGLNANLATGTDAPTPTISLSIDYLAPVLNGAWVETRASVVHLTRKLCFVECRLQRGFQTREVNSDVLNIIALLHRSTSRSRHTVKNGHSPHHPPLYGVNRLMDQSVHRM